jgi:hypothetical protein
MVAVAVKFKRSPEMARSTYAKRDHIVLQSK